VGGVDADTEFDGEVLLARLAMACLESCSIEDTDDTDPVEELVDDACRGLTLPFPAERK
jgi:hypothetical protein